MTQSLLFSPIQIGDTVFENRVVVAPMAQYSAEEGQASTWHLIHWGMLALSGAGLVMVEATAVERDGRATPGDLGLYDDETEEAITTALREVRSQGPAKFGIQLCHAGRKGSLSVHWKGRSAIPASEGGWETVSASTTSFDGEAPPARAASASDLDRIEASFVASALRAARVGFEVIELHCAHGYLLHQFLSPLSNVRSDEFGGSLENRMRFPLRVFEAVRAALPSSIAVGVRLSGSDWVDGGSTLEDATVFAAALKERGCAYADVSSGALDPSQKIPLGPGYQVFMATAIRRLGMPVRAVGMIMEPTQAEEIVRSGQADMVAIGRAILANPRWTWGAAHQLGAKITGAPQYERAMPGAWAGWNRAARA